MKMLTTAAALAAVLVSAGVAMAAPNGSTIMQPNPAGHRSQMASNTSLRTSRIQVERAIDALQHDQEDYGGHREAAIDDLRQARAFLDQALDFWRTHNNTNNRTKNGQLSAAGSNPQLIGRPLPRTGSQGSMSGGGMDTANEFERNQTASNENLENVRRHVEAAIDALQKDAHDYGGFREKAIDRLQAARREIEAALDFRNRAGNRGQHASDSNLQFVRGNIEAAIDRLNRDRADYGGHRVAAIGDLQQANADISSALNFDASHERAGTMMRPGTMPVPVPGAMRNPTISQAASNDSLADARRHIESAIDALQRDNRDYGGFREKAVDRLKAARSQLLLALQFRRGR